MKFLITTMIDIDGDHVRPRSEVERLIGQVSDAIEHAIVNEDYFPDLLDAFNLLDPFDPEFTDPSIGVDSVSHSSQMVAAIGHAMMYCVEENTEYEGRLLVDPALAAAARAFYPTAKEWAGLHDNFTVDEAACRTCGAEYSEFGDGWDGECPDCADRTYLTENPDE